MASRSCANFLHLVSGDLLDIPQTPRALPRVMTVPGIISDLDSCSSNDGDSDVTSSGCRERKIIVANMLPLHAKRDGDTSKWRFSWDEDALLLHLKDGFSPETEVVYIGSLKVDIDVNEQEEVAQKLLEDFNCVPTFLPHDLQKKFYLGFCKQNLWPLFHYMLPMCPDHGNTSIESSLDFSSTALSPHQKYRTLPVRDEILRGLLNCDLIGFHTFDYARHFLSCCSRMLGLDYESKRGHIGLDYFGRTVFIKILPIGVHMGRLESVLNLSSTAAKIKEIQKQFEGKKLILGVDDMDIFKGISLKLLAMEQLLRQHPGMQGKIVLVQIVNPARGFGKDVQEAKKRFMAAKKINDVYGSPKYQPVILIDRPVPRYEKSAYYSLAECCIVNAVRDGMNLVPYKYIVCRQGTPAMDEALGVKPESPRTSMLVVSEFIGCSPSLSGAIRVNPWDIDAVAEALNTAITMPESEKQMRHDKHYRYVSTHDVAYWACSFTMDLDRACQDHYSKRCWGIASIIKSPSAYVISIIKTLCDDPKNTVFIVSGRGRTSLCEWLAPCEKLGIAAEHGYFIRWSKDFEWETSPVGADLEWKKIVEPVMSLYREATDGSSIEPKEIVNRGQHIVEVKPQGVSKGLVAEKVLSRMVDGGEPPDFVMCVGDDKSDEDMFQSILTSVSNPSLPVAPEIFACTVGRKPSKAKYYLDDTTDVLKLLKGLATATVSKPRCLPLIKLSEALSVLARCDSDGVPTWEIVVVGGSRKSEG
ncbi:putative alpha,alpha-trehalose-phosphate synthase 10 [Hibiscus syriacus]|uniref:Alpha,alpha-trehalose-phosphate synthase 10 n=1 Tax=Hibiscus syriacus TaxID=106335 RepID=A0A6A3ALQ4_HIBSY|nr:putative alpha,alpha-trehalose-phosphate synthase 10 [Hibiscus syriacus]